LVWAPPSPLHRLHPSWRVADEARRQTLPEFEGIAIHHPPIFQPLPSRWFPGDYWERMGRAVAGYVSRRPKLRRADLLSAHFLCQEGYAGWVATRQLGMPLVAIARGDDVHAWPERWSDRKGKLAVVLREADALLACSHQLARDATAWAVDGLGRP